jgi:hypothetical protein
MLNCFSGKIKFYGGKIPADAAVFAVVLLLVNLQKSKKISTKHAC